MKNYSVNVSKSVTFDNQDHRQFIQLLLKRWNYEIVAAHVAWCRLMQNNCTFSQFKETCDDLGIEYKS